MFFIIFFAGQWAIGCMVSSTTIRSLRLYERHQNTVTVCSLSSSSTRWVEVCHVIIICPSPGKGYGLGLGLGLGLKGWCIPVLTGTGSGIGTRILQVLKDEYPDVYRYSCCSSSGVRVTRLRMLHLQKSIML